MYFCFTSKKPYKVSESYKAFIDLKVPEDVMGIGADMKGILKAGTYKSESNFVLYHLEKQTGRKDVYAFLNNEDWKTLWELEKTADEGWMEEKYNPKKRLNLKSHKDVYSIELDFQKGTKCNISVVNHKTKEYFYEFFKNTDDLLKYLNENKGNMPDEIRHRGFITEITEEFLSRCKEVEEKIKPVKFIYPKEVNYLSSDREKGNRDFFDKYSERKE